MFPFFISTAIAGCARSGYEAVTQPTINANTFLIFRTQKELECLKTLYKVLKKKLKKRYQMIGILISFSTFVVWKFYQYQAVSYRR